MLLSFLYGGMFSVAFIISVKPFLTFSNASILRETSHYRLLHCSLCLEICTAALINTLQK